MKILMICVLTLSIGIVAHAQDENHVLVPRSLLTPEQLEKATHGDLKTNVHEWAGLGKEVGEAVNSSLSAITEQSNAFAKTGVGKLTVVLVVWKVIGDEVVHIVFGLLELAIFLPLWIWSYRRTCLSHRVKIEKDKWQVVDYRPSGDFNPRIVHALVIVVLVGTILVTVFAY